MQNHIEYNNGEYKILNPVMQEENFADKWNEKPQKAKKFLPLADYCKEGYS